MAPTRRAQGTTRAALSTLSVNPGNHHQTRKRTATAASTGGTTSTPPGKGKGKARRLTQVADSGPEPAESSPESSCWPSPSSPDSCTLDPDAAQLRRILGVDSNDSDAGNEAPSPDLLARAAPPAVRGGGESTARVPARTGRTVTALGGSRPLQASRNRPAPSDERAFGTQPPGRLSSSRRADSPSTSRRAAQRTSSGGRPSLSGGGASSSVRRHSSSDGRRPTDGPRLTSLRDMDRGRPSTVRTATADNVRRLSRGAPAVSRGLSEGAAGGATGRSFGMGGGASGHETTSRNRESHPAPACSRSGSSSIAEGPSFGRLGSTTMQGGNRTRGTNGGNSRTIVGPTMNGQELYDQLVAAKCTPLALAALMGVLLLTVAPHMVIVKADEKNEGATKTERAANGLVSHIFAPWSYAFIGDDKTQFSGGVAGNERNNPYLAAAFHVWPGANSSTDWLEPFLAACASSRSLFHGATREGLTDVMIALIDLEEEDRSASSNSDIFRGARERLVDIPSNDPMFVKLMKKMFSKCIDAHRRSAGQQLEHAAVFGGMHLMRDFVAEVGTPIILHALTDAENLPVPVIGGEEAPHCLATRKAREFAKLKNGGFKTPLGRAFQKRMWYHVYVFMSSKRRTGYRLKDIPRADFTNVDIVRFIAPYAATSDSSSEDEDMIVPETLPRGEDVIIDGSELEDFLRNQQF